VEGGRDAVDVARGAAAARVERAQLVAVALFFTALVTLYNALAALMMLTAGIPPYSSLLAVAFGGYIALFEWRLLQQLRAARR